MFVFHLFAESGLSVFEQFVRLIDYEPFDTETENNTQNHNNINICKNSNNSLNIKLINKIMIADIHWTC